MKKFLKNIVIFFAISTMVLFLYAQFCEWFFLQRKFYPEESRRSWAMKQTNGHYDYAILGSSRAEGAFDMILLDSLTHQSGINIASNGSGFVDNYLVLNKFLQNNNQIKTLYLQVDNYSLDPEGNFSNAFHAFNFLPYWKEKTYQEAIKHYLTQKDILLFNCLPWMRFYVYNKYFSPVEVGRRLMLSRKKSSKRMDQKLRANLVKPVGYGDSTRFFHSPHSDSFSINPFDVAYLEKIVELAKEKNINIIAFTAPDFSAQRNRFVNYSQTEIELTEILKRNKLKYIPNLFDQYENSDMMLFKDPEHLNNYGVWRYTQKFAQQIIQP
jgi:hypothetical protein